MRLKKLTTCFATIVLMLNIASAQDSNSQSNPAGYWLADCNSTKLKMDYGYEISMITIDTGAYEFGYFSSEFYFSVDYMKNGKTTEFECAKDVQNWEDWAIDLYFSFSYSGNYSEKELFFDAGSGYSTQNSYQLKPEFIKIKAEYEVIGNDQLKITFDGTEYLFYRMISETGDSY